MQKGPQSLLQGYSAGCGGALGGGTSERGLGLGEEGGFWDKS